MTKFTLDLNGRTDNERKVIKRLVLDFEVYEKHLKYFNANELVNMFIMSEFYSNKLEYDMLKKRCREFMIDEYPNC